MFTCWMRGRDRRNVLLAAIIFFTTLALANVYSGYKIHFRNLKLRQILMRDPSANSNDSYVSNVEGTAGYVSETEKYHDAADEERERQQHPFLHKECFAYQNFTANFTCTEKYTYRKFDSGLIAKCATELWKKVRDPNEIDPWETDQDNASKTADYPALSRRPSIHWVFSGDSHIRNVFEVIVKRLAGPKSKFRISSYPKNRWEATEVMIAEFGHMKHASYQQVILVDTPLKLTHKWQPLWGGITNSIDAWMKGKDSPASFLLFGGVLHFIIHSEDIYKVEGPEKAAENFRKELVKVKPLVAKYSKIAQVVYKMSDHVQACDFNKIANNDNIDLHNKIAREILAGTGVSLWDSPIPLSDINNEECQLRFKESEKMGDWRCQDPRHIGYLFVEQYLDMLLSDICKDVL